MKGSKLFADALPRNQAHGALNACSRKHVEGHVSMFVGFCWQKIYLETHLALISANFIFQEKDAHFKNNWPFPGMGQEKTPVGREKTPICF